MIKWLGYDDPSQNTWEPEENLGLCRCEGSIQRPILFHFNWFIFQIARMPLTNSKKIMKKIKKIQEDEKEKNLIRNLIQPILRLKQTLLLKPVSKVGCVFPMAIVSTMPHAGFGPNDHLEDAPHFRIGLS